MNFFSNPKKNHLHNLAFLPSSMIEIKEEEKENYVMVFDDDDPYTPYNNNVYMDDWRSLHGMRKLSLTTTKKKRISI